jgi:hypothetical protein
MTLAVSGESITFNDSSVQNTAATGFGFKNRIINGAMVIDQRNAGASVSTSGSYPVDRFVISNPTTSFTSQRSTTAPTGFKNSLLYTSVTGGAAGSTDRIIIRSRIEGFSWDDMGWGTASAQTVTLSFKVRSSLTGTFSGSLRNGNEDRSYPFSFTISAANTFEDKSVTIVGETTGTWDTGNGTAVQLSFDMGSGSSKRTTAGAWVSGDYVGVTGAVSVSATTGATFYITGVQLEKGSTATSFDYRDIGRELIMCQRFFERSYNIGAATGTGLASGFFGFTAATTGTEVYPNITFRTTKRDTPTVNVYNAVNGASGAAYRSSDAASITVISLGYAGTNSVGNAILASGSLNTYYIHWTASSEL